MEKEQRKERRKCPRCGSSLNHNYGKTESGSQRAMCKECGKTFALSPRKKGYSKEIRDQAIKLHLAGASGRTIGKIMGMSKANVYIWAKKNQDIVDK